MALRLEDKQTIVKELSAVANQTLAIVAAEYRGLSGEQITKLRANAHKMGVHLQVVRNTLANRAFAGTEFECLQPALVGPLILAFSQNDPGAAARLFRDFAKESDKLVVTAVAIGGQLLAANELASVANLPTRDEALARLMAVMLAPITKLVRTLAEPTAMLARTLAAVRDKKSA